MKTFIIAEAGANHNRSFEQALALIDVAKQSGCDAIKFQTYSSETLYSKNTPDFAGYKNISALIKANELPREWQLDLKKYCDEKEIEFMSTPFDENAVNELVNIGVKRLKIAGFESSDYRFVDMVCSAKLPVIISIGIGSTINSIENLISIADKHGINDITFLHCNNAYPTPPCDINLDTIKEMAKNSNYKTGFSDHSRSYLTPALAVSAGAVVIEKHFTLSRFMRGPDHPFALEPNELKTMVEYIRYAELCRGTKQSNLTESEQSFSKGMRSIVAKRNINHGELFSLDNITTKRPLLDNGIPASEFESILGKPSNKDYSYDDFIQKTGVDL